MPRHPTLRLEPRPLDMDDLAPMTLSPIASSEARRLRPLALRPPGTLMVHELYRSLQGEGIHSGLPCLFIRLTACHLRCSYCDTPHAFHQGVALEPDEILRRVQELAHPGDLVQVTGGEPLLQPEVLPLIAHLADAGFPVLLETSGSCDISPVDPRARIILDIKTPGSGESSANLWSNLELLDSTDEVKFVVCDRDDFDWAVQIIRDHRLLDRAAVLVSPSFGQVDPPDLANWILQSGLPLRLQLQVHKLLWGATTRGV